MVEKFSKHEIIKLPESTNKLGQEILIPNLEIPEFTSVLNIPEFKTSVFKFPVKFKGCEFDGIAVYDVAFSKDGVIKQARVNIKLSESGKGVLNFNSYLGDEILKDKYPDRKRWIIMHRIVQKDYRKRGLGRLGIELLERAIVKFIEKFPILKTETIEIGVNYGSMCRLIADQKWLEDRGLDEYKHEDGTDLGYRPYDVDDAHAKYLITLNTEAKVEANTEQLDEARFYKILFLK